MTPLPSMALDLSLNAIDEVLPPDTRTVAKQQMPLVKASEVPHPNKPFAHVPRRVPVDQLLNPDISASITQTWTDQAIKCYLTDSDCANCSIPRGQYSFVCQMNLVVPALLQTLGEPDGLRVKKLLPYLNQY
jgi:hypothetical protein